MRYFVIFIQKFIPYKQIRWWVKMSRGQTFSGIFACIHDDYIAAVEQGEFKKAHSILKMFIDVAQCQRSMGVGPNELEAMKKELSNLKIKVEQSRESRDVD